jgi:hypothetical protein
LRAIPGERISSTSRISAELNNVVDVAQVDDIEPAHRALKPGRYHVNQIERDPLPSGHTSRRWGVGIKQPNGSVVIEPDRWDA